MPRAIEDPILAYTAAGEINQIQWSSTQPDWIAICYNNCLEILRVWNQVSLCLDGFDSVIIYVAWETGYFAIIKALLI